MLLVLGLVLFLGLLLKLPCASGDWSDGRAFRRFCYTDIAPLYQSEGLAADQVPYLEARNEYPVGIGMFMWILSLPVDSDASFFLLNVLALSIAAAWATWALYQMVGPRALYLAAAPTLFLYAFLNWDVLPMAFATGATLEYLRRRETRAGFYLGLGAVAKIYPGLLAVPFTRDAERRGGQREAVKVIGVAAVVWVVANAPFALVNFRNWSYFFRFSAGRQVDWNTLWFVGCRHLTGELDCPASKLVTTLSLLAFAISAFVVWRATVGGRPDFPRWTFGFPLLVLLLLTAKVYSPQYSLWLLPWFALVAPYPKLFFAFEAADLGVFVAVFSWLGRLNEFGGLPVGVLEILVVIRAAILVTYLVRYVRDPLPEDSAALISRIA